MIPVPQALRTVLTETATVMVERGIQTETIPITDDEQALLSKAGLVADAWLRVAPLLLGTLDSPICMVANHSPQHEKQNA